MGATMGKNGGNLLESLPSTQGTLHVVMLGLDSAGKTTALYRLKFDQYLNTVPTIGFNCEKVRGAVGKAKGVQFLVWDVGGQEKLRPLWRSYTRCTDGIVFVVDSVDIERMEEAKMELMRTAKCPDNQGVPVLILANKQDLPGAREPKELEKLLGLHELSPIYPSVGNLSSSSAALMTGSGGIGSSNTTTTATVCETVVISSPKESNQDNLAATLNSKSSEINPTTTTTITSSSSISNSSYNTSQPTVSPHPSNNYHQQQQHNYKGWHIQPACAITGEGLHEGLDALYEMIVKKRKMNKITKKKR